jgi:Ca2+-binding RTX toxin-like protein
VDQTVGDATTVMNFQNVDASALGAAQGVSIIGSAAANTIIGSGGDDTIDGAGGVDIIHAGAGDDVVAYRGTESLIDGGSGSNTLQLKTTVTVNLANADQTSGDAVNVGGFANVDAACSARRRVYRSPVPVRPTLLAGGAGRRVIDGGGGADVINAASGNDNVHFYGSEVSASTAVSGLIR